MAEHRVIVVGAGPAGVRCAQALVSAGLRPTVIDEGRRDGGQIYRRQPKNFKRSYQKLYGTEAAKAEDLHRSFDALREHIDYRPNTLVWNISEQTLFTLRDRQVARLEFDALVLCTGATDRLMPVKGWNLAGTYSLGGSQVALKSQACAIGSNIVFLGTGPLLYLVAAQCVKAGASVAAVLDTSPSHLRVKAAPKLLARAGALWNGIKLTAVLMKARVPIVYGVEPQEILGSADQGVEGVQYKDARGNVRHIDCDAVAMGYHVRPETQLADLARCDFEFHAETRQWLPTIDVDGRSSVTGIYLAGDGTRILGADAAEKSGELAALALLQDLGYTVATDAIQKLHHSRAKLQRFAQGLAQAFPWPSQQAAQLSNDTMVCRCESVSVGELRDVVQQAGASEANRAKAFARVGMGRCQGRYCGNAAAEIIAQAADVPIVQVGRLRGQAPVKPLPIDLVEDVSIVTNSETGTEVGQ